MKRIAVVIGTRPEAVKMAPIILRLGRTPGVRCHVCVTGQHREMLDQVLDVFGITPDTDLNLMRPGQTLAGLSARAIEALDTFYAGLEPDLVLVQGDTTTVFCATLAAFYRRVRVGHVEAGLRTWNLDSPYPEEANRVLTSRLATLHFAPTEWARDNLVREGVDPSRIVTTGNSGIDALFLTLERLETRSAAHRTLPLAKGESEGVSFYAAGTVPEPPSIPPPRGGRTEKLDAPSAALPPSPQTGTP
jgi:UDP-N-acetylglucosamine 2-epimerase (non-hydrolysing)